MHRRFERFLIATIFVAAACDADRGDTGSAAMADSSAARQCPTEVREKVQQLGAQMRRVSLLAPDTIVAREMSDAYGAMVTPELLAPWRKDPAHAPGRQVSNPWPARVDIKSVESRGSECRVSADVIYVSTTDTLSALERRPVTFTLGDLQGWRVSGYEQRGSESPAPNTAEPGPADIVRRYYQAIAAKKFDDAYVLWSNRGKASGQSSRGSACVPSSPAASPI